MITDVRIHSLPVVGVLFFVFLLILLFILLLFYFPYFIYLSIYLFCSLRVNLSYYFTCCHSLPSFDAEGHD